MMSGSSRVGGRFDLTDQIIIVTGASRGIGRYLALQLAEAGAAVIPTVRSKSDECSLLAEAEAAGVILHPTIVDVRDVGQVGRVVQTIVDTHGAVDVLVNNAGLGHAHAALDITEQAWDEMMAVNLRGMFFMTQAVARAMVGAGRPGRIINLSSQGGLVGLPNAAAYCTSKGGVNMMTKVLALEWAQYNITVNAIAPTFVYTPGTASILDDPVQRSRVLDRIPLGRLGQLDDVCSAVIYLAAPSGRMVTGAVLVVDGGWTAQ